MLDNEEVIKLIKDAAEKGQFDKIPPEEVKSIYHRGVGLTLSRPYDTELYHAVAELRKVIINSQSTAGSNADFFGSVFSYPFKNILTVKRILTVLGIVLVIASITITSRYKTEYVGQRLIRYDRLMSRVEWKTISDKSGNWQSTDFKNLSQAKEVFQTEDLVNFSVNGKKRRSAPKMP